MGQNSYKNLIVWQKSVELAVEIYRLTDKFPGSELYGLTFQMRRAAVSIPSNIAGGRRRLTQKEFIHFLTISYGSGAELETQLEISKKLSFSKNLDYTKIEQLLEEIMKMLNKLINK